MKRIFLISACAGIALAVSAQTKSFRISYDMAIPLGDLKYDYIDKTSWRGISVDNRWQINPDVTFGFLIGWQVFAQRIDNATHISSDGLLTIHGTQFRTINTFPMQANVHYYLGEEYEVRPWIGLGLGTAYSVQSTQMGFFESRPNVWSFTVTPQLGIDIPIDDNTAFTLFTRYNYFAHGSVPFNYSFIVIGAGFSFPHY